MLTIPIRAHRAPDPEPIEDSPDEFFEHTDPHQPPIRTPLKDEPVPDPNPSVNQRGRAMSAVPGQTRRGNSRVASMQPPSA